MACGCKRIAKKAEENGYVKTKKLKLLSKIITIPIAILFILLLMPIMTLYLIYKVFVKDSTIIVPKKLLKYFA
jgi:hypothetical protein